MSTTTATATKYSVVRGSRESRDNTRDAIGSRKPFQTSGSFYGTNSPPTVGHLPVSARDRLHDTRRDVTYAVMSYETPIAWYVENPREQYWVLVTGYYFSNTTRKHQDVVNRAIKSLEPMPLVELVGE